MIVSITFLRCLAAIIITNAHYTGVYPTDLIANGGLLGDVLFFALSGYCLVNIRGRFLPWYGKRISRVLPAAILATAVFALLGRFDLGTYAGGTEQTLMYALLGGHYPKWLSWFVYPTCYHFVGSILVLYPVYYWIMKLPTREHLPLVMAAAAVVYGLLYLFAYDKTSYHIDTVREPMIRFLFLESMLLGAHLRLRDENVRNCGKTRLWLLGSFLSLGVYFASKLLFSRGFMPWLQPINQGLIMLCLWFVLRLFLSADRSFERSAPWLKRSASAVAGLTLEIYLVQIGLIDMLKSLGLPFPLNWLVLTAGILLAARALHSLTALPQKFVKKRA